MSRSAIAFWVGISLAAATLMAGPPRAVAVPLTTWQSQLPRSSAEAVPAVARALPGPLDGRLQSPPPLAAAESKPERPAPLDDRLYSLPEPAPAESAPNRDLADAPDGPAAPRIAPLPAVSVGAQALRATPLPRPARLAAAAAEDLGSDMARGPETRPRERQKGVAGSAAVAAGDDILRAEPPRTLPRRQVARAAAFASPAGRYTGHPVPLDARVMVAPSQDTATLQSGLPTPKRRPVIDLIGTLVDATGSQQPKPRPDRYGRPARRAHLLSAADHRIYAAAFEEANKLRYRRALAIAEQAQNSLPAKAIAWEWMRQRNTDLDFSTIADFVRNNPDWPRLRTLERRAEEALVDDVAAEKVTRWFAKRPPKTGKGMLRLAEVLFDRDDEQTGRNWLRRAWTIGGFSRREEDDIYRRHGHRLRPDDHAARLDNMIWNRKRSGATRMLKRVDKRTRRLAEVRLKLMNRARGADKAINSLPDDLRSDPALIYEHARWLRRKGKDEAAQNLLLSAPANPRRPDRWWIERRIQTSNLLAAGEIKHAYRLAREHGLKSGKRFADAEFLSGWIALRFLEEHDVGLTHFRRLYENVSYPISRARGAYWSGRAAEELDMPLVATAWYRLAEKHSTTYYGQLAALRLAADAGIDLPPPPPPPDADAKKRFEQSELVKITRLLAELGLNRRLKPFIVHLVDLAKTPAEHRSIADLSRELGLPHLGVSAAKRSARYGVILAEPGYPEIEALQVANQHAEPALVHALARQESVFDPRAVSRVGARGLMQVMPATAKRVARRMGIGYRRALLLQDPVYNARIGSYYINSLVERYDGSYAMALAAYNAGETRVREWVVDWGDPRTGEIDPIDWVELIPFSETRNYVQRVLESVQVYRQRLNPDRAARIALMNDLLGRARLGVATSCAEPGVPDDTGQETGLGRDCDR